MVVKLAAIAATTLPVLAPPLRSICTPLVSHVKVRRQHKVRHLPSGVEMKIRALESGVQVRGAVVKMNLCRRPPPHARYAHFSIKSVQNSGKNTARNLRAFKYYENMARKLCTRLCPKLLLRSARSARECSRGWTATNHVAVWLEPRDQVPVLSIA